MIMEEKLTAALLKEQKKNKELVALLKIARCPNCDGSGNISHDEWEQEQCQWCYERQVPSQAPSKTHEDSAQGDKIENTGKIPLNNKEA